MKDYGVEMVRKTKDLLILNGTVFINGKFEKKDIRIEDGKFAELADPGELSGFEPDEVLEQNNLAAEHILDATDKFILPGLVDVHTHGRIGEDFSLATADGLQKLLASYASCGVTSVVGTTMTNEPSLVEEALKVIENYKDSSSCAKLLGIHMEGPFLGREKKGAHDAKYLKNPDWDWFEKIQNLSGEKICLVTIDPSLPGAEEFIKKCQKNNIKVSLGHTACDYETAVKAQRVGADHVTHTFNAMNPLHHREPGLIGAALDTGMYMELICDGIHVHPAVIRLLFAAHPEKVILISDSISVAGLEDGEYQSGGFTVTLQDGKATLKDGTIAGSAISLFDAMVNAIRFGVTVEQAVNSATYLPAKSVCMEHMAGSIAVDRAADFLVVDYTWKLARCYRDGISLF